MRCTVTTQKVHSVNGQKSECGMLDTSRYKLLEWLQRITRYTNASCINVLDLYFGANAPSSGSKMLQIPYTVHPLLLYCVSKLRHSFSVMQPDTLQICVVQFL